MELNTIKSCGYCPLCVPVWNDDLVCTHPRFIGYTKVFTEEEENMSVAPEWCPLRKESLTIKLDKDEQRDTTAVCEGVYTSG